MDSLLRADTLKLEAHQDILRQERRAARLLIEQLRLAQRYALPDDSWYYVRLIGKAEKLERFFGGMIDQVDHMGAELSRLSLEINGMLKDAGSQLKSLEQ